MGLCAAIGLSTLTATNAFADEKHHDKGKVKIPETVEGIFKSIQEYRHHLGETVEKKKLADVHHLAFAIRDLANALPPKAAANKKKQVEGTVKNIAKLAGELDESGDAGNQAKTEVNLKKFDGLLKVLHAQFGIKMNDKEGHEH